MVWNIGFLEEVYHPNYYNGIRELGMDSMTKERKKLGEEWKV